MKHVATATLRSSKTASSIAAPIVSSAAQQRAFSRTPVANNKVAVVGAAGGIGQPLSMLLKLDPRVTQLNLLDVASVTPGVAADLSHMPFPAKVQGFSGDQMEKALAGMDIVVIPAGVPRKPGMTRDDLFNINAGIVKNIASIAAKACPNAALLIISNPVNSTVPIAAEVLKQAGVYNPKKLFGVTTLDIIRANTFVAEHAKVNPSSLNVEVIGGHAGITIIPLLSKVKGVTFSNEVRDKLTHRIMFGGDEVVQAKGGAGSATLSMAYAGYRFANSLMRGMAGEKDVKECAYVQSSIVKDLPFFSSYVTLGKGGAEKIHEVEGMNDYEKGLLEKAKAELSASIKKGVEFANKK